MSYLNTEDLDKRRTEIHEEIEESGITGDNTLSNEDALELHDELEEIEFIEGYCPDFLYGETLIPELEFEDYAREFAYEVGAIENSANWPYTCIDWERAASELAMDYSLVKYRGSWYYVR